MIDVHAHFAEEGYSFPQEWNRIRAAGVSTVILAGDTLLHTAMHRDFCSEYEGAYFTAGVHPSDSAQFGPREEEELLRFCAEEKCVAVGEIGLDYHYPDFDKAAQRNAFIKQLLIAERAGLPVQIHSRDSAQDMLAILKEMHPHMPHGFLLHCYSHGREMMESFLNLGAYFSFGGVTCFRNAKRVEESVIFCPAERILTETDSPYLSPFRGEKNSPANIPVILKRIEELKGEPLEKTIEENAKRLFQKLQ